MALSDLTSPTAIRLAISECDRLGRDEFLRKYGYGYAREWLPVNNMIASECCLTKRLLDWGYVGCTEVFHLHRNVAQVRARIGRSRPVFIQVFKGRGDVNSGHRAVGSS